MKRNQNNIDSNDEQIENNISYTNKNRKKRIDSKSAVEALVCGIIGFGGGFICIFVKFFIGFIIGLVFGIYAIALGAESAGELKRKNKSKSIAVINIALGITDLILISIGLFITLVSFLDY